MVTEKNNKHYIAREIYEEVIKKIPISCVDLLIVNNKKFLLGKRVKSPAMNEWFLVGGRIYKGESIIEAAKRKAKEELGLALPSKDISVFTVGETIFKGKTIDENRHSLNVIALINLNSIPKFSYDKEQTSSLKWFSDIDPAWHTYVKETLRKAGFKDRIREQNK